MELSLLDEKMGVQRLGSAKQTVKEIRWTTRSTRNREIPLSSDSSYLPSRGDLEIAATWLSRPHVTTAPWRVNVSWRPFQTTWIISRLHAAKRAVFRFPSFKFWSCGLATENECDGEEEECCSLQVSGIVESRWLDTALFLGVRS